MANLTGGDAGGLVIEETLGQFGSDFIIRGARSLSIGHAPATVNQAAEPLGELWGASP